MKNKEDLEILTINQACLKEYTAITLGLENCENFTINTKYIIDIRCVATRKTGNKKRGDIYRSDSGYIRISHCAKDVLSDFAYHGDTGEIPNDYDENDYKLMNRLKHCMDVCAFSLERKDRTSKAVYIPYDPVEDVINRAEIDYSNCPSFDVDGNGDMEIRFGNLSRLPILERNNYIDLIEGWEQLFGVYRPKKLKLSIDLFKAGYAQNCVDDVEIVADIVNKKAKRKTVCFCFEHCERVTIEAWARTGASEFFMSQLLDGKLYTGIGCTLSIICRSCRVSDASFD